MSIQRTIAAIFIVLATLSSSHAGTSAISWSQSSLEKVLIPGQTRVVTVSFRSSSTLTGLQLSVVPTLRPVLTVTPAKLDVVTAGIPYPVTISITVPSDMEVGTQLDGTIRAVVGAQTVPQVLKVSIEIETSSFERPRPSSLFQDLDGSIYPVDQAIIVLQIGEGQAIADQIAGTFGGSVVGVIPTVNAYQLGLPSTSKAELESILANLDSDPRVVSAFKNFVGELFGATDLANLAACRPDHPEFIRAYNNVRLIDAYEFLSTLALTYSATSVGIVDTGIYRQHVEFAGVDTGAQSITSPSDLDGHGTSVSGIIGANNLGLLNSCVGTNGLLQTQMNGVISGLPIPYSLRVRGFGLLTVFELASDMDALGTTGVPIVNVSMGIGSGLAIPFGGFAHLTDVLRSIVSSHPATLYVIAAGEDDLDAGNITPANLGGPAGLSNLITVAATNPIDDSRADTPTLTQAGPSNWGTHVDLAAPGVDVYAPTINLNAFSDFPYLTVSLNPAYQLFRGTSASAPMVTGAAAILEALKPQLTPQQQKAILMSSGDCIQTDKPIGNKRLNVLNAVQRVSRYRVLVDASRDGGVWWAPQASGFDPNVPHQGKTLADFLHAQGMQVTELPRPFTITPALLADYDLVIRSSAFGGAAYTSSEITAYLNYVSGGGRLMLLSEYLRPGQLDPLALSFGLDFRGTTRGANVLSQFSPHPSPTLATAWAVRSSPLQQQRRFSDQYHLRLS